MTATETRPVEPGPYADPPRNWRRVGLLAAAWGVLWVVVGAIGWVVMQFPELKPTTEVEGSDSTPGQAVDSFIYDVYVRREAGTAGQYVCEAPGAASPKALVDELVALDQQYGLLAAEWTPGQVVNHGETATVTLDLKLQSARYVSEEAYQFSIIDDGGWRICGLVRTPYSRPAPDPSTS